jgi:hypothetical protein
MRRHDAFLLVSLLGMAALTGCANARYVQVDRDSGVVSMPANTNCWPTYYRDHAEALMRQKCPSGYEVVREEEEVVGQTAHTNTHTDTNPSPTLNFGGVQSDSNREGKNEHGSSSFAGIAVPLGPTHENSRQTTNYQNVTEWRIYYRAKSPSPPAAAPPNPLTASRSPYPSF